MNKTETLFTVKEVADKKLLWYGQRTIRQLIKEKKIRTVDLSEENAKKSTIRIPESAIQEFLQAKSA